MPSQDDLLALMGDWSIDELAVSFLESGFWPQEALIAVREPLPKSRTVVLVVIEGNRRLAALKKLQRTRAGLESSSKWKDYVKTAAPEQLDQLTSVPYIEMPESALCSGLSRFSARHGDQRVEPCGKGSVHRPPYRRREARLRAGSAADWQ